MASRIKRSVPVTVNDVLDGHAALDLECLDRLYLHGYLGQLQVGGQVIQFLNHRGYPVPSPACLQQIGDAFRRRVASFAEANHIPVVPLKAADRNIEVMQPYLDTGCGDGPVTGRGDRGGPGAAAGVHRPQAGHRPVVSRPQFSFDKKDRRVTVYYFYLWDAGFGPAFIKVCTYCPWPVKIWVNGHEWAKQQARKLGLGFTELSNGFASCDDPALLQRICDALQPGTIEVFFQRWLHRLPLPLGASRPGGRLLVGAVDGPGRGIPHHRVHPAPPCPGLLRRADHRQPRPRPPGHHGDHLRPAGPHGPQRATGRRSGPRSSPAALRSPSTPSTSTPASSNT